MKPIITKPFAAMTAEDKAALSTKDGKKIAGHSRIQHPGQPAINFFILDDGTEVIEDDAGNRKDAKGAALKWPGV